MADQKGSNVGGGEGTVQNRGNRTRKRTTRNRSRSVRPGAGTGTGIAAPVVGIAAIENFGTYVRGAYEGFALAHNMSPQQLLTGTKKHLTW